MIADGQREDFQFRFHGAPRNGGRSVYAVEALIVRFSQRRPIAWIPIVAAG